MAKASNTDLTTSSKARVALAIPEDQNMETSPAGSTPGQDNPVALVDSSAIVALVDRRDATHDAAVAAYQDLLEQGYKLFTTNFVIAETVGLLTDGAGAEVARQWLRDHRLTVYHADEEDERRARALVIGSHSDQGLTYVDAISLVVME